MKEIPNMGTALSISEIFGKFSADVALAMDGYRRENEALIDMLLERGLKRKQIRREVRKRVKYYRSYEGAFSIFEKVCQRMRSLVLESDPLTNVVENLSKMKKRDAN
jgi:hypothetical protein